MSHRPPRQDGRFDQALGGDSFFSLARESAGSSVDPRTVPRHPLVVSGAVLGGALGLRWIYDARIHRRETIEALARASAIEIEALIAHCLSVQRPSLLPLVQRRVSEARSRPSGTRHSPFVPSRHNRITRRISGAVR